MPPIPRCPRLPIRSTHKPVVKKPTGRKPGGQPGHPPHLKELLPPERVTHVVPIIPEHCDKCQAALPANAGPDDPPPTRHQVAELPPLVALITEYQGQARTCPCCGEITRACIPEHIRAHGCGPQLTATLAYLTGKHHLPKRAAEEISADVFQAPISLGTIWPLEQEVSTALEPAHAEALAAVKQANVKNVDETSWKEGREKHGSGWPPRPAWPPLSFTASVAWTAWLPCWATPSTAFCAATAGAFMTAGRWLCGKCAGPISSGTSKSVSIAAERPGLLVATACKSSRKSSLPGTCFAAAVGRAGSCKSARSRGATLRKLLDAGRHCADSKAANFCANLIALEPALWQFAVSEGVEPTNNHAERVLRRGVLWRKISFGCHSANGCRFVEHLLTTVQTLPCKTATRFIS